MDKTIENFFSPRGVAIIGASTNPQKLSYGILENLKRYGYKGPVYPVNPKSEQILGFPAYSDVSQVPDPVDMAVVVLPAPLVPPVIESCGVRGIKSVVIISGGFREVGGDGASIERKCVEIAHKYEMRLVGPNCVGTMDLNSGLNTTFIKGMPSRGGIGFLSQSGAVLGAVVDLFKDSGIGFSHLISLGNEADVTETDLIKFFADNPDVRVISAYVEAIRDGVRFIELARKVSGIKPIVMLKSGRTESGAKAVSSHTGSIAGSLAAYQAAFEQSGVIEVRSVPELFTISSLLDSQPLPKGNRVVLVTNAGGPAALASDALDQSGLVLAEISEETKVVLAERMNASAQLGNPVDMLGGATPDDFGFAVRTALNDSGVDMVIAIQVPTSMINSTEVAQKIVEQTQGSVKPVMAAMVGGSSIHDAQKYFNQHGIPCVNFPEDACLAFGRVYKYTEFLNTSSDRDVSKIVDGESDHKDKARSILAQIHAGSAVGEAVTRQLLQAYDIPVVPGGLASSYEDARRLFIDLGKKPVVLKVISPQLIHKSDAGAVRLNIKSEKELEQAYHDLISLVENLDQKVELEGILVERMLSFDHELIIGINRDENFGPLMMFGYGGIFVEVFKDVAFRIVPVSELDVKEMIASTKASRLLNGFRNFPKVDLKAIEDVILKMSQIAVDFPQIQEMEINPLAVCSDGSVVALDARMILKK
ncbi:MAG: acetate--CoA ligase family protein [Anaerolineales bacterium]|nr:acetate--CoA ligase family protein [Anaerolineales bacterium]